MWPLVLYVTLVLALFVRFQSSETPRPHRRLEATPEHVRLIRRHHRVFYALLVLAPIEWWLRGGPAGRVQLVGAALLAAGLMGYRRAGGALGAQLTPVIAPSEPAVLVERGPYRRVRHPMYLAEIAMACGAALMLDARVSGVLAVLFAAVVLRRIAVEEDALANRLPEYRAYAARTYRLIPYVY